MPQPHLKDDIFPWQARSRSCGDAFGAIQALLQAGGEHNQALDLMDEIELRLVGTLPPSNVTIWKLRIRWQESKQRASWWS